MSLLLQQILATVIVVSAVGYITLHYIRKKSKSGCGACKALKAVKNPTP